MTMFSQRAVALVLLLVVVLSGVGISMSAASEATPAPSSPAVSREVLHAGLPDGAPGQVLELVRYTIPPLMKLPVHVHPGMQIAVVEAGSLHYTVIEGTVEITRAADVGTNAPTETLSGGQTTAFEVGDRFVEPEGMVHFGENRSTEPVVLLVASLFAADQPPSREVEAATPAT